MVPATTPSANDYAVMTGKIGGRSKSIQAAERRIEALVNDAPLLSEAQLVRLHRILSGAVQAIEPAVTAVQPSALADSDLAVA